jgi:hypothetical protein
MDFSFIGTWASTHQFELILIAILIWVAYTLYKNKQIVWEYFDK